MSARGRRALGGLMAVALGAQALAGLIPRDAETCICSDAVCCRPAKAARPVRPRCHSETDPPASLRCGHPADEAAPLPTSAAVLPVAVATAPSETVTPLEATARAAYRDGFDRLDGPPPRASLAS